MGHENTAVPRLDFNAGQISPAPIKDKEASMASRVEAFLRFGAGCHSDIEAGDMRFENCGLPRSHVVLSADHVSFSIGKVLRW